MRSIDKTKRNVVGIICHKLANNWYLLRPHFSDKLFVVNRAEVFMQEYFGNAIESNEKRRPGCMTDRRMGFEDGYLACLEDLRIKLTYEKDINLEKEESFNLEIINQNGASTMIFQGISKDDVETLERLVNERNKQGYNSKVICREVK